MRRRGIGGGAAMALALCLLPGSVPTRTVAQSAGQIVTQSTGQSAAPQRLRAADLPDLTLAPGDGLRIGRAALPPEKPPLPPRTAARVAGLPLAPADPEGQKPAPLTPVAAAELPDSPSLSPEVLARVMPVAAPRAGPGRPVAAVLPAPAPRARAAARPAAVVPPRRLAPVVPDPLPRTWLDPQDPAGRAAPEALFGAALPPGLAPESPEPESRPADPGALALAVQTELQRLNCYLRALDGDWGPGSRSALNAYYAAVGRPSSAAGDPTPALLQELQARPGGKLCPDPLRPPPAAPPPAAAPPAPASASAPRQSTAKAVPKQRPAAKAPPEPAKRPVDDVCIGCF